MVDKHDAWQKEKIIEAYIGEYASGKSEVAVSRALQLLREGKRVTLVDLDTVEPCYTIRAIKSKLEKRGLTVLAWKTEEMVGLGETGGIIKPAVKWALKRQGDIIIDVGYGVHGAKILNLMEGIWENPYLQVIAVVNVSRPFTSGLDAVVEYIHGLARVDGLLNNTHLAEETTTDIVEMGAKIVSGAAVVLRVPVVATTAVEKIALKLGKSDCMGNPVWCIEGMMSHAFW